MTTVIAELQSAWTTLVLPNYPDQPTLSAAIDLTTMTSKTSNDLIAEFLAVTLVNLRNPATYGYLLPEDAAGKKAIYTELNAELTAAMTNLTTIQAAIHAYLLTLP